MKKLKELGRCKCVADKYLQQILTVTKLDFAFLWYLHILMNKLWNEEEMSSNLYSTCKENINSRMFQLWWPLTSLLVSSVFHSLLFLLHLYLQNMKNVLHLFPPEVFCSIYTLLCGGKLRGFLMFFHLKRLNFQRLFSNRCHLLNSYVSLLILTFLSSVLQWKCNQNKALWTVWSIYCTFLSFLCLWKHPCLQTRRGR